jgi:hypothetical protein
MQQVGNPFPIYLDLAGGLLDAGSIYIGTAGDDPEVSPIAVYWDAALTILAAQPIRTRGGYAVNSGSPALFFTGAADYSMRVRDADGDQVFFLRSASESAGVAYQPLDDDLTQIAALSTKAFGRSLLTAVSDAAGRALLGIGSYLASAGGTVTGNILRGGAGPHLYHKDGSLVSGRVFVTAAGAADPTSQNGDIWIELAP